MTEIKLENLGFAYDQKMIFRNVNVTIDKPELVCILGPNGTGKSTLMHCLNKLSVPTEGRVLLDGHDLQEFSLKDLSKIISFVPHQEDTTFSMTVLDTVLMGRIPHSGNLMTSDDVRIAAENIKLLGMQSFAMHNFDELSAGQHQKVMIARSLAQEPRIMLLDEPTANLDVKYQMLVMRMLRDVAKLKGITVITICHDLNVTATYADRILMLYDGSIYADGKVDEVLTHDNIVRLYGIDCEVMQLQGRPHIALLDGDELDSHLDENYVVHDDAEDRSTPVAPTKGKSNTVNISLKRKPKEPADGREGEAAPKKKDTVTISFKRKPKEPEQRIHEKPFTARKGRIHRSTIWHMDGRRRRVW